MKQTAKESLAAINKLPKYSFESCAFGCLLGMFIGDTIGSYLEFNTSPATPDQIQNCMMMNGGGPHNVGAG